MTRVIVPIRYPLPKHFRATLEETVRVSRECDTKLTVLRVDLYQSNCGVTRAELKQTVEAEFGPLVHVRYVIRRGFPIGETILGEVAAKEVGIVAIGSKRAGRWRRMLRRLPDGPDIDVFLHEKLDCAVITVHTGN